MNCPLCNSELIKSYCPIGDEYEILACPKLTHYTVFDFDASYSKAEYSLIHKNGMTLAEDYYLKNKQIVIWYKTPETLFPTTGTYVSHITPTLIWSANEKDPENPVANINIKTSLIKEFRQTNIFDRNKDNILKKLKLILTFS